MSDLIKRLEQLAGTLNNTTGLSKWCQLVYEVSNELIRLETEKVALLKTLIDAKELADDLYSYCIDQWRWKYGDYWDAELAKIAAAIAAQGGKSE